MAVYAISDLHFSFGVDKPMNVFGKVWDNYEERIRENWINTVSNEDVVVIPGDISWGINFSEALPDFKFINDLPGKKIILRGNHDYYFATKTKLEKFFKDNDLTSITVLHNNAIEIEKYILCGTRGWGNTEGNSKELDEKIIKREEGRLRISLEEGKKIQDQLREKGIDKDFLVALHYPPFIGNFQKIMQEYNVKKCIYGHLHGYGKFMIKEGFIKDIEYVMVSCDHTDFKLIKL